MLPHVDQRDRPGGDRHRPLDRARRVHRPADPGAGRRASRRRARPRRPAAPHRDQLHAGEPARPAVRGEGVRDDGRATPACRRRQITLECTEQQAVSDVDPLEAPGQGAPPARVRVRDRRRRRGLRELHADRRAPPVDHQDRPARSRTGSPATTPSRRWSRRSSRSAAGSGRSCSPRASSGGPTSRCSRALGVELGQGYLIGRPAYEPQAAAADGGAAPRPCPGRRRAPRPRRRAGPAPAAPRPPRHREVAPAHRRLRPGSGVTIRRCRPSTAPLPAHVRAFLETPRYAAIATTDPDGAPRQAVIWFLLDGDTIVINSLEGRRWPTNLRRDPRISVAITDADHGELGRDQRHVEVVDDQAQAQADIAAMARRYHAANPAHAEELIERRFQPQQRVSFRVIARSRSTTTSTGTEHMNDDEVRGAALVASRRPGRRSATRRSAPRTSAGTPSGRGTTCSRSSGRGSSRSSRAGRRSPRRPRSRSGSGSG